MGFGDISWGAVLVGAAAAVAIIAVASDGVALPFIGKALAGIAVGANTATYVGAGVVGGIAGEFLSDLLGKTGNAITTIAGR